LANIFAADSFSLSSFIFFQWAPKDALISAAVRIGRARSSIVDNVGTNRKRVCHFLLVRHTMVLSYTVSEIAYFLTPFSFGVPGPIPYVLFLILLCS